MRERLQARAMPLDARPSQFRLHQEKPFSFFRENGFFRLMSEPFLFFGERKRGFPNHKNNDFGKPLND
ncbi:hypothetical protein [Ureibacillus sinduriensis]|uniref:Uncharacterized protein n=1 Tax=Ureibacillus sinduriensis BLB-1 = JCM 15800 TaxID=1384057 RepID=A0A0A3II26_9BACL|nr:hypothetical protein [Ureibacillus sinduriensis]KGR74512.1 hypothetical protein CD33_15560 [Ureibacillus sinduriensis BLB-1 = JCM 15800]